MSPKDTAEKNLGWYQSPNVASGLRREERVENMGGKKAGMCRVDCSRKVKESRRKERNHDRLRGKGEETQGTY